MSRTQCSGIEMVNASTSKGFDTSLFTFFSFWVTLKRKAYTNKPHALNELKRNMTTEINNLNVEVLHKVATNMVKDNRKTEQGRHVDHYYKKIHYCYKRLYSVH